MGAVKNSYAELLAIVGSINPNAAMSPLEFNYLIELYGLSEGLNAAVEYRLRGASVVPQRTGAKRPAIFWKVFQDRQPTVDELASWFNRWPDAGPAVVLGLVSNLFVIDVDGIDAEEELKQQLDGIPLAPRVNSGSKDPHRFHLWFTHPEFETKARATPWHPQLEFRGHGGIVVAPPALHKSGRRYRWAEGRSLDDLLPPKLPKPILDALLAKATVRRPASTVPIKFDKMSFKTLCRNTRQFLSGKHANAEGWNAKLFAAACDMAGNGVPHEKAEEMLLLGAQPWNDDEREKAVATIASAFSEPRSPAKSSKKRIQSTPLVQREFEIEIPKQTREE
jgi:hypothetical protein